MQAEPFTVSTDGGEVRGLVLRVEGRAVAGRARLESDSSGPSPLDLELAERVLQHRPLPALVVFRGKSSAPSGSWKLDDDLDDPELDALAQRVVRAQIPSHRALVLAGVAALVHCELRVRELAALRAATWRIHAELSARIAAGRATPEDPLDAAILAEHVLYVGMGFARVQQRLLRDAARTLCARADGLRARHGGLAPVLAPPPAAAAS